MNKQIISKAKNNILAKKKIAQKTAEDNYQRCLSNPVFVKIDDELRSLILDIAEAEFNGKDVKNLHSKQQILSKARDNAVKTTLGGDFSIFPKYCCEKCHDTGMVDGQYCDCLKAEVCSILLQESGLQGTLFTFSDSDLSKYDEEKRKELQLAYSKMEEWCEKVEQTKIKNILFFGPTGVGKSSLVEAMTSRLIEKGYFVLFTTAFNLSNKLLKFHTTFNETKNSIIDPILEADILVIDDLGTEPILKNVSLEYLYLIISEREINHKPIIVTTNLTIEGLREKYGERIFSRIMNKQCSLAINLKGNDERLRK